MDKCLDYLQMTVTLAFITSMILKHEWHYCEFCNLPYYLGVWFFDPSACLSPGFLLVTKSLAPSTVTETVMKAKCHRGLILRQGKQTKLSNHWIPSANKNQSPVQESSSCRQD